MYNTDENYNYLHATPSSRHNTFNSRISTTRTNYFLKQLPKAVAHQKFCTFVTQFDFLFIKNSNTQETPPLLVIKILETLLVIIRIFGTNIGSLPQLRNRTVFHPITSRSYENETNIKVFGIYQNSWSSKIITTVLVHFVLLTTYGVHSKNEMRTLTR